MNKLLNIFRLFSLYTDSFEKKVDRFLKRVRKKSKHDLILLLQEDLVRVTIFLEYQFKGYKKLKKAYRRKLYENTALIVSDFQRYLAQEGDQLQISQHSSSIPVAFHSDEHFRYLLAIMHYLSPASHYRYQESSTFEKLLRDPVREKLVGDCNQIVTLYIYLYSLRYPISDLRVKLLPSHICLHYRGLDIEATTGKLASYDDFVFLAGVEEIVPTNILDISDPTEKKYAVSPKNMLRSAELAYHFSGHRATVEKNLLIAYHNVAVYHAKQNNFTQAILFANKSGSTKLQRDVRRMEATNHLKAKRYKKAAELFRRAGDSDGEKACYQNELADISDSIRKLKTIPEFRSRKSDLQRMKELALRLGNQGIIDFVNDVLKKLNAF